MRPPKAFTLIELIVVMSIIAFLSSVAMIDYSMSVKKARLQVAAEELVLLLQDGGVRAQAEPSCFALELPIGDSPVLSFYTWSNGCQAPSSVTEKEVPNWANVAIQQIKYSTQIGDFEISDTFWFVFSPPDGKISLYKKDGTLVNADTVEVALSYNNSDEDVFRKIVKITPVTASFVIQ